MLSANHLFGISAKARLLELLTNDFISFWVQ